MSCYHPLVLINTARMADPIQRKIVERLKLVHAHDSRYKSMNTVVIPRELAVREGITLRDNKAITIPCGQCIGCRLDYSRTWAERCIHEASSHEFNYFLTLTYDDAHLPVGSKGLATLIHDEMSDFMKRLRSKFERKFGHVGIRFFGCGEYGDKSLRPHYHIILFNCPIPDLQERHPILVDGQVKNIRQYASDGSLLYYSPSIGECWNKGTSQIGYVTYESCAYVSRYIVKKQKGQDFKQYAEVGVEPPYVRMSRDPGIGYDWYHEHFEQIYLYDNISFKRGDQTVNVKPGKYCDRLYKDFDEQAYYELKEKRRDDFYDSVDVKRSEAVDLTENNHKAEAEKKAAVKSLIRNI